LFYWWFGVGPVVTGAFYLLAGSPTDAVYAQENGMESLWIVAIGLPLYAFVARRTLAWLETRNVYARFLMPQGHLYKTRTLLTYLVVGTLAGLAVQLTSVLGIQGISIVNYLGGTRVDALWVGLLNAITGVSVFATVGIMVSLSASRRITPWWLKVIGVLIILHALIGALTSGWKSSFLMIFLYIICARLSMRQRPPWYLIVALVLGFLFVVEPFVFSVRNLARQLDAQSPSDRIEIFRNALSEGALVPQVDWQSIRVDSLFRGIYPLAGELGRRNSLFEGYWSGETIKWGFQVLVPRALSPDKPDQNIGNFFSRTVASDIGVSSPDDYLNNVAVSIPFEFLGNYGWLAGVFSFPLIGFFWALLCGWLLSAHRISDHPLSPFMTAMAMGMEQSLGAYLAGLRDLAIPLVVMVFIWVLLRKQL
jgi:hypothetical protein